MNRADNITVVVPVRNRAELVCRTLDSIAGQTMTPARIIVVDNGSDDNTREIVEKWAAEHDGLDVMLIDEPKSGASAARNAGLAKVETEYVAFFDSDDVMMPKHLERVAEFMGILGDAELVFFDRAIREDEGWTQVKGSDDQDLLRGHLLHCSLSTTAYVANTELVRRAGGWDEELPRWNDYELGVRLLLEAKKVRKLAGEPTVTIFPQDDSISSGGFARSARDLERALDRVATDLRKAGKLHHVKYVYARRAILAALIAREGDTDEARRLLDAALNNPPGGLKTLMSLQIINMTVRVFGHGGAALAAMLIKEKKPRSRRKDSLAKE